MMQCSVQMATALKTLTFNNPITGGKNLTLSGTGTGTYNFTINTITANNVLVTTAAGSTNNSLTLNSGGAQNFILTSDNVGYVTGALGVAGNFNFNGIQNLIGGLNSVNTMTGTNNTSIWNITINNGGNVTDLDGSFVNMKNLVGGINGNSFNFTDGVSISGTVNGGSAANNSVNFDNAFASRLTMTLGMPVAGVISSGVVTYDSNHSILVNFNLIQASTGNGLGYIKLPNDPSVKVTNQNPA